MRSADERRSTTSGRREVAGPPVTPILTLTEEELLVLTGGDLGVVPPSVVPRRDESAAEAVQALATRVLMARGLIVPTGEPRGAQLSTHTAPFGARQTAPFGTGQSGPFGAGWVAAEPLGLTLTVRAAASAVLALHRVLGPRSEELDGAPGAPTGGRVGPAGAPTGGRVGPAGAPASGHTTEGQASQATRYLHLHERVAVIEDVTPAGLHSLLTVQPDRFRDAIADFVRPPDAATGFGRPRCLGGDGSVARLLADLGHPTVLVEAVALPAQGGRRSRSGTGRGLGVQPVSRMLALGPGGTFASTDSLAYHPVDPDAAIDDLLRMAEGDLQGGPP